MNVVLAISPLLAMTSCVALAGGELATSTSDAEVVRRLIEMDKVRASALHRYVSERRYGVE